MVSRSECMLLLSTVTRYEAVREDRSDGKPMTSVVVSDDRFCPGAYSYYDSVIVNILYMYLSFSVNA